MLRKKGGFYIMSNNIEKTFEERLASLKKGCIILGILQIISVISSMYNYSVGKGNIITVILSVILLLMLFFIYKYTKERNTLGPLLENIFGVILLIDGILFCLTIVGILFGIIYIVLSIGIFKEASYFKKEIQG